MKKIGLGIVVLCIALSAMASYKTMHKKKKPNKQKKSTTIQTANNTKIKSLLMGRAGCYGTCPIYKIEIFEDGRVHYSGIRYVDHLGLFEKNFGAEKNINLFKEFSVLKPDTLKYLYETKIADLPGFYYFINYGDSIKKVVNADAGPKILRDWANKIDEYAQIDGTWKKIGNLE